MERRRERWAFFRQSGWMLMATVVSGAFLSVVHTAAKEMPSREQYALFTAMVDALLLLAIPASGVQGMFAQLTAASVTEGDRRALRGAVRGVLRASAVMWVVLALGLWMTQGTWMRVWRTETPWILWWTLGVGLVAFWQPIFLGLLQGRQDFLWLGNTVMVAGLGRLVAVGVMVLAVGSLATGAMGGVFLGSLAALLIAVWATRDLWRGPADPYPLGRWLGRLVPVTLGFGSATVMLAADTLVVQATIEDASSAYYMAAGRIGRALVMVTTPLALVLFPRVARSAATGEATGALRLALGATLGTGLAAAVACTVVPEWPLRILYAGQADFLQAAPLVTWYAWAMLPLTAAYTLVNSLIARGNFRVVPWLVVVAGGYVGVLLAVRERIGAMEPMEGFRWVLMVLGGFSGLMLAVSVLFSCRRREESTAVRPV
jgi:O-antigen/teichoic acid export membrane protein